LLRSIKHFGLFSRLRRAWLERPVKMDMPFTATLMNSKDAGQTGPMQLRLLLAKHSFALSARASQRRARVLRADIEVLRKQSNTNCSFAAKLNSLRYAENSTAAFRLRKGHFQLLSLLSTNIPLALLLFRQLGYFRHATDEFLLNDVRFIGFHFLPPGTFLPRAAAAKAPATRAGKFTNIDAGALTLFHEWLLSSISGRTDFHLSIKTRLLS